MKKHSLSRKGTAWALAGGVALVCALLVAAFSEAPTRGAPLEDPLLPALPQAYEKPSFKDMDTKTLERVVRAGPQPGTFTGPTEPPPNALLQSAQK